MLNLDPHNTNYMSDMDPSSFCLKSYLKKPCANHAKSRIRIHYSGAQI
jgi:hypothetical protein